MNLKDYIRGHRQGKEANKLERKAMDDPFLQDAIDGYDSVKGDHISAIEDLEKRLSSPQKRIDMRWWWAAAAVIVLLVGIPLLLKLPTEEELMVASSETSPKQTEIIISSQQKDTALDTEDLNMKSEDQTIKKEDIAQNKDYEILAEATPLPPAPKEKPAISTEKNNKSIEQLEEHLINEPVILSDVHKIRIIENIETNNDLAQEVQHKDPKARIRGTSTTPKSQQGQLLVSGRIVDETGEPIIGATIFIPETKFGAVSDTAGNFQLFAPKNEQGTVIASYLGMNDVNIPLKENVGDIVMKANNVMLSEVVVVGYGVQKKVSVAGAVATVKAVSDTFGEKEFKKYFSENYDKEICTGQEISFTVEFFIDPAGRPGSIHIKENSCPALETEIRRLLLGSPPWSEANRKVNLRIELFF